MGVQEITGSANFDAAVRVPNLVVVDFFATWCGPCVQIAPFLEQLSNKYPHVVFLKVDADQNKDLISRCGVRAFPTFHFYVNGTKVDEMKGANPQKLEGMVTTLQVSPSTASFGGKGNALGSVASSAAPAWDGVGNPPGQENARAARLKAFGHLDAKQKPSIYKDRTKDPANTPPGDTAASGEDEDEAIARAIALSMAPEGRDTAVKDDEASSSVVTGERQEDEGEEWDGEEMVPVPVDATLLAQLLSMDFSDTRARKGLVHGSTLEGALSWLEENADSPDLDQPYMVKRKDAVPKKPLTAEEKQEKLLQLKEKAAQLKREREKKEKAEEIAREKQRRTRGQTDVETDEERQRLARKREAARKKKEKDDVAKERQRLRAEIARDKELRKANKGVLPSVLGVDGYNPSAVQYDQTVEIAPASASSAPPPVPSSTAAPVVAQVTKKPKSVAAYTPPADPAAVVDSALATISRYRTGGDGGAALKLLTLLLRNVTAHPEEAKYRSINTEGKAYRGKLAHLVGPAALLKAVGFREAEGGDKLVLPEGEGALVAETVEKLIKAEALYTQMN